jgi:serine protease Do
MNDVIVSLDDNPVKNVEGLTSLIEKLVNGRTEPVQVLVAFDRGSSRMLTVAELARPGLEDPGMEARKAWVPVAVQVLTPELAEKLGVPGRSGVRITRVIGGGAAAAGLKVGDLVFDVDGDPIEASQPSESEVFETMIRQYKIGSTVTLSTRRGTEDRQVKVQLDSSPRRAREMKKFEDLNFEFRARDVSDADRMEMGLPAGERGVIVEAVREGGWAALAHLADGDLILAIGGEPVSDVAALQRAMEAIGKAKPETVVMQVRRGFRTFFVEMTTGWEFDR